MPRAFPRVADAVRQGFKKRQRVRRRGEYLGIQRRGRRFSRGAILLVVAPTPVGKKSETARLGLVVSRKAGPAVTRNLLKRWIREWFRVHQSQLPKGLDLVVIPKPDASRRGHAALSRDLAASAQLVRAALGPDPRPGERLL